MPYYLLIWRFLSNYDVRYLCAYIKSDWNYVFPWTLQKIPELYPIPWCRNPPQTNSFRRVWAIHWKICGNCPPTESLHTRKSEEMQVLSAVESTFAFIYLCLLFSAGLDFSKKYVLYDSLKTLLFSWIAKNSIILKFPWPHVVIWPWTSICCNSGCRICCLVVRMYLIFL